MIWLILALCYTGMASYSFAVAPHASPPWVMYATGFAFCLAAAAFFLKFKTEKLL